MKIRVIRQGDLCLIEVNERLKSMLNDMGIAKGSALSEGTYGAVLLKGESSNHHHILDKGIHIFDTGVETVPHIITPTITAFVNHLDIRTGKTAEHTKVELEPEVTYVHSIQEEYFPSGYKRVVD